MTIFNFYHLKCKDDETLAMKSFKLLTPIDDLQITPLTPHTHLPGSWALLWVWEE